MYYRALFLLATLSAMALSSAPAQPLAWMEGCWERRMATGRTLESWQRTATGLNGGAASYRGDTLTAWEFLRITTGGASASYIAAPSSQAPHSFPLRAATADSAHFADPDHDFPQQILYRRIGRDSLYARVWSGAGESTRAVEYRFARTRCEPVNDLTRAVATRDSLQALLDSMRALGRAPGLSAAIALPDSRVITVTSGLADSVGAVPLTPTHRMLAGSVGKTFFAALALDLVARGQLDLDARIATWLADEPWFARLPNAPDITVRHLMSHTSGLVRYEFQPEFAADLAANPLRDWKVSQQLEYVLGDTAPFRAGTGWEYSDTNYLVLALILEKITGESAYDAIRSRFLAPLRLRSTSPSVSPQIARLANGYGGSPDPLGLSGPLLENGSLRVNPQFEWAGGGYVSTPEDLARWAQAWYQGRAFPPAVLRDALNGVPARALGPGARYGLGVIIRDTPRGATYGHSGFFPGYLTEMRYYVDSRVAVVVQANTSDARAIGRGLGAIADVLADRVIRSASPP